MVVTLMMEFSVYEDEEGATLKAKVENKRYTAFIPAIYWGTFLKGLFFSWSFPNLYEVVKNIDNINKSDWKFIENVVLCFPFLRWKLISVETIVKKHLIFGVDWEEVRSILSDPEQLPKPRSDEYVVSFGDFTLIITPEIIKIIEFFDREFAKYNESHDVIMDVLSYMEVFAKSSKGVVSLRNLLCRVMQKAEIRGITRIMRIPPPSLLLFHYPKIELTMSQNTITYHVNSRFYHLTVNWESSGNVEEFVRLSLVSLFGTVEDYLNLVSFPLERAKNITIGYYDIITPEVKGINAHKVNVEDNVLIEERLGVSPPANRRIYHLSRKDTMKLARGILTYPLMSYSLVKRVIL